MRIWPIAFVLLASTGAFAQNVGEMEIPTINGRAEGTSTYTLADGTRVLTDWHAGQKHGAYREIASTGVVLHEGRYEDGRRAGTWVRRDESGNTVEEIPYLLGRKHGAQRRFEITRVGPVLVESTPYILGVMHGLGRLRDRKSGAVLKGHFTWGMRHGRFASTGPGEDIERFFVCDEPEAAMIDLASFERARRCNLPLAIYLPRQTAARDRRGRARGAKKLQATLCRSREELRIPVFVGGEPIQCPTGFQPATKSEDFGAFARNFLVADRLVAELRWAFRHADHASASFAQTFHKKNGTMAAAGRGEVDVYAVGPAEWTYDSKDLCNRIEGAKHRGKRSSASGFADALEWAAAFAFTSEPLLFTYAATIVRSSDGGAAVRLVPNQRHENLESIELELGMDARQRGFVYRSTVRLRTGERVETRFSTFKSSKRHGARSSADRTASDHARPIMMCGG